MRFFISLTFMLSQVKAFLHMASPRLDIQPCLMSKSDSNTNISHTDLLEVQEPIVEPVIEKSGENAVPLAEELLLEIAPLVLLGGLVALGVN